MFKIYAKNRLLAADSLRDLSDSSIRRIANDKTDKRSAQAKQELKRRTGSKPRKSKNKPSSSSSKKPAKQMNPLVKTYKGLSRWNTKRKINQLNREEKYDLNTNNWFFGPTEQDFEGSKYERKRKLNDYINNRRQEINKERNDLTQKLNKLNEELGN